MPCASPPQGPPEPPPGGPPEAICFCDMRYICAKIKQHSAFNASRTSKRRVSCIGMSWRRIELITLTLPKSGVARTVCYVNCFVQPMANTKTCLAINNSGEYRKAPFNFFYGYAEYQKAPIYFCRGQLALIFFRLR